MRRTNGHRALNHAGTVAQSHTIKTGAKKNSSGIIQTRETVAPANIRFIAESRGTRRILPLSRHVIARVWRPCRGSAMTARALIGFASTRPSTRGWWVSSNRPCVTRTPLPRLVWVSHAPKMRPPALDIGPAAD
ncbi:hypothetical protein X997_4093 [Burkholderia pseudomallei A79C]|nr:hypothetical protein X997_4093 [Burkholderia pseudomallei A79C]